MLGTLLGPAVLASACDPAASGTEAPEAWPTTEACEGLDEWAPAFVALEDEALARIDARRAEGADCGERGKWEPAPSLRRRTALDCAARYHALDMATRGYFGRLDPDDRDEARPRGGSRVFRGGAGGAPRRGPARRGELVDRTWAPRAVPCRHGRPGADRGGDRARG